MLRTAIASAIAAAALFSQPVLAVQETTFQGIKITATGGDGIFEYGADPQKFYYSGLITTAPIDLTFTVDFSELTHFEPFTAYLDLKIAHFGNGSTELEAPELTGWLNGTPFVLNGQNQKASYTITANDLVDGKFTWHAIVTSWLPGQFTSASGVTQPHYAGLDIAVNVPEPSVTVSALAGLGIMAAVALRRRRQAAA